MKLFVIAPHYREFVRWCRENDMIPGDVRIVCVTRADRLRGVGNDIDAVWLHGAEPIDWAEYRRICDYMNIIRARGALNSERHVYT